jgi:hypothetical protein
VSAPDSLTEPLQLEKIQQWCAADLDLVDVLRDAMSRVGRDFYETIRIARDGARRLLVRRYEARR